MSIGERISALRNERNLSQVQLAKLLDVTRQAVSKWENDLSAPDTIKLIQLADVLDTDVEYLATGNYSKTKSPPEVITVIRPIEKIVEKVVEKPVVVEKIVEVERIIVRNVAQTTENPSVRRVYRTRYIRRPLEYFLLGCLCFLAGLLIGRTI